MLWIQKSCRRLNTRHLGVAVALAVTGCGGESGSPFGGLQRYAVKGKVVLVDGKPVTAGRVVFLSDAPPASGAADIGSDGAFEVKGPSGDGLPAANYRVHIAAVPAAGTASGGRAAGGKPAFATRYLDEDTSQLTATVTTDESKNHFEFKLDNKNATEPTSKGGRR